MREILFRGIDKQENKWIFGDALIAGNGSFIGEKTTMFDRDDIDAGWGFNEIIPETIGQFTGLTDKNGERIFEGDIISTDLARDFLVVEFKGGAFVFNCNDGEDDYYDHINASHELDNEYKYGQIIGNIHDNPELLEAR